MFLDERLKKINKFIPPSYRISLKEEFQRVKGKRVNLNWTPVISHPSDGAAPTTWTADYCGKPFSNVNLKLYKRKEKNKAVR